MFDCTMTVMDVFGPKFIFITHKLMVSSFAAIRYQLGGNDNCHINNSKMWVISCLLTKKWMKMDKLLGSTVMAYYKNKCCARSDSQVLYPNLE